MSYSNLATYAREWDVIQRARIAMSNLAKAKQRAGFPIAHLPIDEWIAVLETQEAAALKGVERAAQEDAEPWLMAADHFRRDTIGLGPSLLCVLGLMPPLIAFANPGKVNKYCGLHVVDGKAPRRERGKKLGYSQLLHAYVLVRLVDPVIKCRASPYRIVYDDRRAYTAVVHPEWGVDPKAPDLHYHRDAVRYTAKRILRDTWRAACGHKAAVPQELVAA
jgi:hypothetical protein